MDPARRTALPRRHTLIKCPLRALLLFRKPLSSTVPMREFALMAIDPAWQTGSVPSTSSSASLLEVSYAPVNAFLLHLSWLSGGRPSPAHCIGCIFITSRSLLPNGSAPLPASNNLISSYTTLILLPCPQSAASSLASPSLPFPAPSCSAILQALLPSPWRGWYPLHCSSQHREPFSSASASTHIQLACPHLSLTEAE